MGGVLFLVTSFPALHRGIALRMVAGLAGYDIVGRIHLRDRETGKEYRCPGKVIRAAQTEHCATNTAHASGQ